VSNDRNFPDEFTDWPQGIVGAEEQGVRVFWLAAATMPDLVARLALVLGEHMADGDELHVTYNACNQALDRRRLPATAVSGPTSTSNTAPSWCYVPTPRARRRRPRRAAGPGAGLSLLARPG
jgi:hypothetical protein